MSLSAFSCALSSQFLMTSPGVSGLGSKHVGMASVSLSHSPLHDPIDIELPGLFAQLLEDV
jgi:hypothetical protein